LQKEEAQSAKTVSIVGDFNNWDIYATPMKKLKNGGFTQTLDLGLNTEYQFRYLIDETKWENDWHADKYAPTPYGNAENSVVVV
jgi:1,4-alpha-glucan branching enzyme